MDDELHRLWREHEALIERIIASVGNRRRIPPDDRDDFGQDARLRFFTRKSPFLQYEGRSGASWETFLRVVINNVALDFIHKNGGKCRPSAAARRLDRWAVRLEELVYCHRCPLHEAVRIVMAESEAEAEESSGRQALSERALYEIYDQLPMRYWRELVSLEFEEDLPSGERADHRLLTHEAEEEQRKMHDRLNRALDTLEPVDRLIVRLRYYDGFTLARIGKEVGLPLQRVHDRIKRILERLRMELA